MWVGIHHKCRQPWHSHHHCQQPTTNNQQPTTNNQQPTTNNQQPTTQQPTTNNRSAMNHCQIKKKGCAWWRHMHAWWDNNVWWDDDGAPSWGESKQIKVKGQGSKKFCHCNLRRRTRQLQLASQVAGNPSPPGWLPVFVLPVENLSFLTTKPTNQVSVCRCDEMMCLCVCVWYLYYIHIYISLSIISAHQDVPQDDVWLAGLCVGGVRDKEHTLSLFLFPPPQRPSASSCHILLLLILLACLLLSSWSRVVVV